MVDATAPGPAGLDTAAPADAQDVWDAAEIRRGHLRVRTLVRLRWIVLAGEAGLLALLALGFGYDTPAIACGLVIVAGVVVNVVTALASPPQRVMSNREAV